MSYDCKVPGCTQEAATDRGRNAYLCDEHIRDRPAVRNRGSVNGYLGKVKELTAAGKRLDRAVEAEKQARAELAEAKTTWNQLVDTLGFVEIEKGPGLLSGTHSDR